MARRHHGHASPISLRKPGNRHRAFPASYDTTAPEGAALCYSLLARIGGGRCNDGPGRVSTDCHSSVLTLRGSLDLRNVSLRLRRAVDTSDHPSAGPKTRI